MDRSFYKNCSDEDIILYASYDAYAKGNMDFLANEKLSVGEALKYLEANGNVGDTSLEVIYKDDRNVTFLSIDSSIKVILNIAKGNFTSGRLIELE